MNVRALAALFVLSLSGMADAAGPVYSVNSIADVPDAAIDGVCRTAADNNICTLRAAVMEANLGPNPLNEEVTINLPAGTYTLTIPVGVPDDVTNGDLNLTGKVRIVGAGFDKSLIVAGNGDRVFYADNASVATLVDLRIQGGRPPESSTRAGKGFGGGIYSDGSNLTLVRCLVRDNQSAPTYNGGGIYTVAGYLTLVDSVMRLNVASTPTDGGGHGGALSLQGTVTAVTRTMINLNTARLAGGIDQEGGTLTMLNSTLSQNAALGFAGGLFQYSTIETKLNNVSIVGNTSAGFFTGGGAVGNFGSPLILSNSLVTSGDFLCDVGSAVTSNGHNVLSDPGNCVISGSYVHADPNVSAVGIYGGISLAHIPNPGSPAIDAGLGGCLDALGAPVTTDQRGVKRPIGAHCDLGAVEVEPIGDANGDGVVNVSDVFYLINYLFAGGVVPLGRANVNGDSAINVSDVFYLVNYLFAGGAAPI